MIEAGTKVAGYRVERMIGRGGMGVVYEAMQVGVGRRVALKLLRPELADDPGFAERFLREARLQASLEHPNVVEVYDAGESDEGLFLAMRLIEGRTLLDLIRDRELDADRSLRVLDQVCGALDAAHAAALVHRDVKPQNVLVAGDDRAFLADFGLTRAGSESTVASSRPLLGSIAYVAPEIVRGEEPTPAADRYSVAATFFHCLTGDVVFPRGSDAAILYAHAAEPPPSAREFRPELPDALDEVLGPALAKQPGDRPATAQAIVGGVRDALGTAAESLGPPGGPTQPRPPAAPPPSPPPMASATAGSRRRRAPIIAAALLVAAAIGAAAALILDGDESGALSVPPVPVEATALGSDLASIDRSVNCRGGAPAPESGSCAIVQTELPGRSLIAPADGVITGWTVLGASGELALDVIRPRGSDTVRVGKSQWELAGNAGPHHFETELAVEAGDRIGLELAPGASIGVSDSEGATTQRWLDPLGGAYGSPDRAEGTGFDYEVAFRADFVEGERVELPEHLTGFRAARAPDGRVRDTAPMTVAEPRDTRLSVKLVEVGDRVALDVFRKRDRTLRVFIDDLRPEGIPVELKVASYPGEPFGEAGVWWVNPNTGRTIFHNFVIGEGFLEFAS